MIFAKSIFSEKPIKVFNFGKMTRSFTYIDDVIECIERLINKPATLDKSFDKKSPNPATSWCPIEFSILAIAKLFSSKNL